MNLNKKQYSLILTKDFQALDVVGVKKSMKYLCTDVGRAMDPVSYQLFNFDEWVEHFRQSEENVTIRTEKLFIKIPEIIVLKRKYVQRRKKGPSSLSKRKVFERDSNACAYCGCSLSPKTRTIDHIIPTSKGGARYDYANVVACCSDCNSIKSDISLDELILTGPHLKDTLGNVLLKREDRWCLDGNFAVKDDDSVVKHVPKSKWLPSWEPYLKNAS